MVVQLDLLTDSVQYSDLHRSLVVWLMIET